MPATAPLPDLRATARAGALAALPTLRRLANGQPIPQSEIRAGVVVEVGRAPNAAEQAAAREVLARTETALAGPSLSSLWAEEGAKSSARATQAAAGGDQG